MIFGIYDVDKDGHLSFEEVKKYLEDTNGSEASLKEEDMK